MLKFFWPFVPPVHPLSYLLITAFHSLLVFLKSLGVPVCFEDVQLDTKNATNRMVSIVPYARKDAGNEASTVFLFRA